MKNKKKKNTVNYTQNFFTFRKKSVKNIEKEQKKKIFLNKLFLYRKIKSYLSHN